MKLVEVEALGFEIGLKRTGIEVEMITLNCRQDLVKDSKCQKIIPYEAEFIFPELWMTIDSCQDLAEKKLQKNTPPTKRDLFSWASG